MPHILEQARSGRAKCRGCGLAIAAASPRFGERLPNPYADDEGEMTHWFHPVCAAFMRPEAFLALPPEMAAMIDDYEGLAREAQLGIDHHRVPRATTVGRAASGRAQCRSCRQAIEKDSWRMALMYYQDGRFAPSGFIHLGCAAEYLETTAVMPRLRHFSPALSEADLAEVQAELERPRRVL